MQIEDIKVRYFCSLSGNWIMITAVRNFERLTICKLERKLQKLELKRTWIKKKRMADRIGMRTRVCNYSSLWFQNSKVQNADAKNTLLDIILSSFHPPDVLDTILCQFHPLNILTVYLCYIWLTDWLTDYLVAESQGSTLLIPKSAFGHDPEPVPST